MKTHRFDLTGDYAIRQGATFYVPFAIESAAGTTLDLATEGDGYTVGQLVIRDVYGGEEIVTLTTDNGGVVIEAFTDDSGDWSGYWYMSAASTSDLADWGDGVYTFEIGDGALDGPATHVERPMEGSCVLSPETTT